MEWRRGRRTWVAFLVSALFMTLAALNAWLQTVLPAEATEGAPPVTDPMTILVGAVSGHIFVIVAIFAVMRILVAERESGMLAWTASKPVSRSAIWLAKFSSATRMLWIVAGVLPLMATVALVVVLYGACRSPVVLIAAGMGMVIALFVAIAVRLDVGDQPGRGGRDHDRRDLPAANDRAHRPERGIHADVDPGVVGEASRGGPDS